MYDNRTVFEKMTSKRPLPDEPYDTMYQDGYTPYEIIETAKRAIIRHNNAVMEERAADRQEQVPMNVKFNVEVKTK